MAQAVDPRAFLEEYERRTNSHDIARWSQLIADHATFWFTTGTHVGKSAIIDAVAHNFRVIEDETYRIGDIEWVARSPDLAVVRYRFSWEGTRDGVVVSGSGRGTNVMERRALAHDPRASECLTPLQRSCGWSDEAMIAESGSAGTPRGHPFRRWRGGPARAGAPRPRR